MVRSFRLLILVVSKKILISAVKTKPGLANTCHTWEHGTVQSLVVVHLWVVHDNCEFTKRSLVY